MGFSLTSGTSTSGFDTSGMTTDAGENIYSLGNPQGYAQYNTSSDYLESQKLTQFYPAAIGANGTAIPWWQSAVQYGITRAIDAAVGKPITNGNGAATAAGQNGQTYAAGQTPQQQKQSNNMLLLLIVVGGFFAMAD